MAARTEVAPSAGWRSLAAVRAGYRRKGVGWAMADHLRAALVVAALTMASARRQPAPGLVHHRDRGCQSTALAVGQRLQAAGMLPSLGAVGDCYAKAVAERFFATLTGERLHRRRWSTRPEVQRAIVAYSEVWSNRQRLHSTLSYSTPAADAEAHHRATAA